MQNARQSRLIMEFKKLEKSCTESSKLFFMNSFDRKIKR